MRRVWIAISVTLVLIAVFAAVAIPGLTAT